MSRNTETAALTMEAAAKLLAAGPVVDPKAESTARLMEAAASAVDYANAVSFATLLEGDGGRDPLRQPTNKLRLAVWAMSNPRSYAALTRISAVALDGQGMVVLPSTNVSAAKEDSDAYLLDQVMPSINDDQFAAVIGLHGFVLVNDLAVDPKTQTLEGTLQHQERELTLSITFGGSYTKPHDGEWSIKISEMDESSEPSVDHQPFSFDPETDAVALMKSVARLLGGWSEPNLGDEPEPQESTPEPPAPEESTEPSPDMESPAPAPEVQPESKSPAQ